MPTDLLETPLAAPPWISPFRSDDLDTVRSYIGQWDGSRFRTLKRAAPMGYSIYLLRGKLNLGGSEAGVQQSVRGNVSGAVFMLQVPTGTVFHMGRRSTPPTTASSMVCVPPLWEFTRDSPPGGMFVVEVPQPALTAELASRAVAGADRPAQQLAVTHLTPSARQHLLAAAHGLIQSTRPGLDPRHRALADARFIDVVAALSLRDCRRQRPGQLSLERARDLEGWIDAHLGEPITLGRLCQVAGVGQRCLQRSFEHRRGVSPMRFVHERRIVAAHDRLRRAAAHPGTTVTETALELGFNHLGRFAQDYRQVVGESPSETLAWPRR